MKWNWLAYGPPKHKGNGLPGRISQDPSPSLLWHSPQVAIQSPLDGAFPSRDAAAFWDFGVRDEGGSGISLISLFAPAMWITAFPCLSIPWDCTQLMTRKV